MKTLHTYNVMHGTDIIKTVAAEDMAGVAGILSEYPDVLANMTEIIQTNDIAVRDLDNVPVLSVFTNEWGEKFVRLKVDQYDIKISLHDGPDMDWYHAMEWTRQINMRLFSQEEGMIMYAFKKQINAMLRKLGGEPLRDGWYLTSAEYSSRFAWLVNFNNGAVDYNTKYYDFCVRAVAAS